MMILLSNNMLRRKGRMGDGERREEEGRQRGEGRGERKGRGGEGREWEEEGRGKGDCHR